MLNVQIKRHTGKTIIFHKGELKKYLKVEINLTQIHSNLNFFYQSRKDICKNSFRNNSYMHGMFSSKHLWQSFLFLNKYTVEYVNKTSIITIK